MGEAPRGSTAALSVLTHVAFGVAVVLLSRPRTELLTMTSPGVTRVNLLSERALRGRLREGVAVTAAPPVPRPPVEKATPPEPSKAPPVIEKIRPKEPAPSEHAMAAPKAKPQPTPVAVGSKGGKTAEHHEAPAAGQAVELPSAGENGATSGAAEGTANFGASVSGFDTNFPFAYYVDQLQSLIGANWLKPESAPETVCEVSFTIARSGQVSDVKLENRSGNTYFDRAAMRAVFSANPLPPLPPQYKPDQLGVRIRFR